LTTTFHATFMHAANSTAATSGRLTHASLEARWPRC
jgi:hypothetical protein